MKKEEILPLGSVVKIKKFGEKLMIAGVNQKVDDEVFHYAAFIHPYGYVGPKKMLFFNSDAIEKVFFRGYEDEDAIDFFEDIEWLYEKNAKEGK